MKLHMRSMLLHTSWDSCFGAAATANADNGYTVPKDFSAADLPAVDTSNANRAYTTIVAAFKERFVDLRKQVPSSKHKSFEYI